MPWSKGSGLGSSGEPTGPGDPLFGADLPPGASAPGPPLALSSARLRASAMRRAASSRTRLNSFDPGSGAAAGSSLFSTLRSQSTSASPPSALGIFWAAPVLSGKGVLANWGDTSSYMMHSSHSSGWVPLREASAGSEAGGLLAVEAGVPSWEQPLRLGAMASGVSPTLSAPTWPEASSV